MMYWLDLNDDWIGRQFKLFTMLLELKQNSPESFFNTSGTEVKKNRHFQQLDNDHFHELFGKL